MKRPSLHLGDVQEIYLDESSQTKHRYLALGCIVINGEHTTNFEHGFARRRLPELPSGELKWTKVSKAKLPAYLRAVDYFFDNPHRLAPLHFHSLVVDTPAIDDRAFNSGSREIGFNKEIYQLCMKCSRLYRDRLLYVYPDFRQTDQSPQKLRTMLNFGRFKQGEQRDWPFRRIHMRDSADTPLLQMVDVLLGALTFRLNKHDLAIDASPSKMALSAHIFKRAGVRDPFRDTSMAGKFTIWHRQLRRVPQP